MSKKCTRCNSEKVALRSTPSGIYICDKCGARVDSNLTSVFGSVGIHPVLAKKYGVVETVAPVQERITPTDKNSSIPSIPGYQVIELIGKGAMGSVYLAIHLVSGRRAALKILAPELSTREDLVARFQREIAALRSFRHKNVIAILDSGYFEGTHYFSMEYVSGVTLRRVLKAGALSPQVAIKFCRQILDALSVAHARGIIHRDLKPENIIIEKELDSPLTGEERLVLVDFGLAGILNEASDPHPNLTHSKVTMGTVNYMAPEQHVDAKRVDHRTDIYSAGVILYECLTSDLPLGRFALLRERGVSVPELIDKLLLRAMARSVDDRYTNVDDFDRDLKQAQDEIVTGNFESLPNLKKARSKERISSLETIFPTKWMKSPPWLKRPMLAAAGALFILFVLTGIFFAGRTPHEFAVSHDRVSRVYGKSKFDAPIPFVLEKEGGLVAQLIQGKSAPWEADSPVWSFQKSQVGYFASQADIKHVRKVFSLGMSPVELSGGQNVEIETKASFDGIDLGKVDYETLNGLNMGKIPDYLGGLGLFLVDKLQRRAVGVVLYEDGKCGITTIRREGMGIAEERMVESECQDLANKESLKISCDTEKESCVGAIGSKKFPAQTIRNFSKTKWNIALGCKNLNCLFETQKPKSKA